VADLADHVPVPAPVLAERQSNVLAFCNLPAATKQRLNASNPNAVALPPSLETGAKLDGTGFVDAMPPAARHQLGQLYAICASPYQRDMAVAQFQAFRRAAAGGTSGFASSPPPTPAPAPTAPIMTGSNPLACYDGGLGYEAAAGSSLPPAEQLAIDQRGLASSRCGQRGLDGRLVPEMLRSGE
jgi:hypothetical protein